MVLFLFKTDFSNATVKFPSSSICCWIPNMSLQAKNLPYSRVFNHFLEFYGKVEGHKDRHTNIHYSLIYVDKM